MKTIPHVTNAALGYMRKFFIQKDLRVLEFGCGSSTIWLAKRSHLISIEHSIEWHEKVSKLVNAELILLKRPYFKICKCFSSNYFDFIYVDGRDRVECVKASMKLLKKGGVLMLDDAERFQYKEVYVLLKDWQLTKSHQKITNESGVTFDWQTNWWKS